jgi:hypothetical protein
MKRDELEEFAKDIRIQDTGDTLSLSALNGFKKEDNGKAPLAILFDTASALDGVARVMAFGAKKYDRMNWDKVDDRERYLSAALRHISAHCRGERVDGESGEDHLDHAICSLLFVSELIKR